MCKFSENYLRVVFVVSGWKLENIYFCLIMGIYIDICIKNCYVSIYCINYLYNVLRVLLNVGRGFFIIWINLEIGV